MDSDERHKYEAKIAQLENDLQESNDRITDMAMDVGEMCVEIERGNFESDRQALSAAFQYISLIQNTLRGQHVCGEEGCELYYRDLQPAEDAAFQSAADMLSRVFDKAFPARGHYTEHKDYAPIIDELIQQKKKEADATNQILPTQPDGSIVVGWWMQ